MRAFYNEIDRYCCDWLQNLMDAGHITPGKIDDRSIADLSPDDVRGYERCHFFAGIAGWELALALSGYTGPVWTGSCPCQSFSSASNARNMRRSDERHLWPHWFQLISRCKPPFIVGEQVPQAGDWFDEVCDGLENVDYTIGAAILPACSVGFDHARPRIYFACYANSHGKPRMPVDEKAPWLPSRGCQPVNVGEPNGLSPRMATMRAFGNAIVPQVAAEFIKASMTDAQS